jgi:alkaline phosphatase D
LDYLEEPKDSERRLRGDDIGIFQSYRIKFKGQHILLVLFDVRYENDGSSILGEAQWAWFEREVAEWRPQVLLLGSGVQFMLNNRLFNAEHWPACDIQRLSGILSKHLSPDSQILLLSGDVHHAQFL